MTAGPMSLGTGAPGIRRAPRPAPPVLRPERLDITGFVGIAPRGPVDEPVTVTSWTDYQWRFGSSEGPGKLPYAVHAFFAGGGLQADVLRVSPLPRAPAGQAVAATSRHRLVLDRTVTISARDEGTWGNALSARIDFDATRFVTTARSGRVDLPTAPVVPVGTLLRLRATGLPATGAFRWVTATVTEDAAAGRRCRLAVLDTSDGAVPDGPVEAAVVTATVTVTDGDPTFAREEQFGALGLRPDHPRWIAQVLAEDSRLVAPGPEWAGAVRPPDPLLTSVFSTLDHRVAADRWAGITAASFFDADTPTELLPTDLLEAQDDGLQLHGLDRLAVEPELGLVLAPDLLWSHVDESTTVTRPVRTPRPSFAPCTPTPSPITARTPPREALLDPGSELDEIVRRQRRMVELAERQRRFVALLDVPPHLSAQAIARWRATFDSSYAAAYHPWLRALDLDSARNPAVIVPPSTFAAGIIADRENRLGLPWGPANALAADAVEAVDEVSDDEHDALADLGIDVFRAERDGFRLTTARTLSADPDYRQLSVRRLMTMLALVLQRQTLWLVFEPHTIELRSAVVAAITALLRGLYRNGAFAGDSEDAAFFVRCDESLNPESSTTLGRLVAEVGVCPSVPLEYIVLRISQDADGTVAVG